MEEQQKSIDEIFRQSLGDYREAPPAAAWDKVAGRLDDDEGSRRRGFFLRWPWISLLVLLLAGGVWFIAARYGGGQGTGGRRQDAPVAINTGKNMSTPDIAAHDTLAGQSASINGVPATNTRRGETNNNATATENEKGTRRKPASAKNHSNAAKHAASKAAEGDRTTTRQVAAHPVSGRKRRTAARTHSPHATRTNKEAVAVQTPDAVGDKSGDSHTAKKPLARKREAGQAKAPKHQAGGSVAAGHKASVRKSAAETTGGPSDKTAQQTTAMTGASSGKQPGDRKTARASKSTASRNRARQDRYGAKTPASKVVVPATAKEDAAEASGKDQNASTKSPAVRRQSKQDRYAAKAPAADRADAVNKPAKNRKPSKQVAVAKKNVQPVETGEATPPLKPLQDASAKNTSRRSKSPKAAKATPVRQSDAADQYNKPVVAAETAEANPAKKQSSAKAAAAKKQALPIAKAATARKKTLPAEEGEKSAQQQTLQTSAANASKKNGALKASAGKPVNPRIASADHDKKPAIKPEAVAAQPVKKSRSRDTGKKAGVPVPVRPGVPSVAKQTAPQNPAVADKKPAPVQPAIPAPREPEVGKWHPTVASPAQPATTADNVNGNGKDEGKDAEEENTNEAGGSGGGGGGGAAAPSKNRKQTSFSLAALAGYEVGLQQPAPNQIVGSFRLLWHFDPGIAIGIQPAFRYGNLSTTAVSPSATYQRTSPVRVDSVVILDTNKLATYRRYDLSGTFDSIVVASVSGGGAMWTIELPLILSYKIAQAWHLYGGASVSIGGKISTTPGSVQTYTTSRFDSVKGAGGTVQGAKPVSAFQGYFSSSTLPEFSAYKPANTVLNDPASARFGYLFGIGYERKRIIFDASVHQQVSGYQDVDKSLQKVFSSPYIRLSLGYFLLPQKNTRRSPAE